MTRDVTTTAGGTTADTEIDTEALKARDKHLRPDVEVALIGTGFGGMHAAVRLQKPGIEDFRALDRARRNGFSR